MEPFSGSKIKEDTRKDKLLIIGAGGHGKVVADIAVNMKNWESIVFLDDDENITQSLGFNVVGKISGFLDFIDDYDIFVGIGNNIVRERVFQMLKKAGANIPVLIHPKSVIGTHVYIGSGTAVMAGVIINSSTYIGEGCIINTGATIDHDNILKDFVHISPGAHLAGTVKIGKGSWLGIGSVVNNNITVTDGCIIGASSTVLTDIIESGTYIGTPSRKKGGNKNGNFV
ncbi:acetyltransferase [Rossellomorea marisflavi]|uniref:acetyltransferase n=1 Tax=Rossellomorea marisflavi TaxID=189381 RepID=UPI003457FE9F